MGQIPQSLISQYRSQTYRLDKPITTVEAAILLVEERGFMHFWPIKGVTLPSLWSAVAGDRPVADAHDDPGHTTWGWKDSMLGKKVWYYGKVLRKRASLISLDTAPYFYALSENYGSPDEDYLIQYLEGRMTQEAKSIFEALLDKGPLNTLDLRRATRMTNPESKSRFERALVMLQSDFKVLPVGISRAGGWRYAFVYDLVHRHYPSLPDQARQISQRQARQKLTELYLRSVGAIQKKEIGKLFGWRSIQVDQAIKDLEESGVCVQGIEIEGLVGDSIALQSMT
jgi:hypothetical protein